MGNGIARSDYLFCTQDNRWVRIPHSPPNKCRYIVVISNNYPHWVGEGNKAHICGIMISKILSPYIGTDK